MNRKASLLLTFVSKSNKWIFFSSLRKIFYIHLYILSLYMFEFVNECLTAKHCKCLDDMIINCNIS